MPTVGCVNEEIEVRRATVQDADAIAGVHARSWPVAYQALLPDQMISDVVAGREARAGRIRDLLADESADRHVWVAAQGPKVVGMAIWGPSHDDDAGPQTADLRGALP